MYNLHTKLKEYISLTGDANSLLNLPQYLCYECIWILVKFYKFKRKCLLAQNLLKAINKGSQITVEDISHIDRSKLHSNLSLCTPKHTYTFVYDESEDLNVKDECKAAQVECIKEDKKQLNCVTIKEERNKPVEVVMLPSIENAIEDVQHSDWDDGIGEIELPIKLKSDKNKKKRQGKKVLERKKDGRKVRQSLKPRKTPVNEDGLTSEEVAMLDLFEINNLSIDAQIAEVSRRQTSSNYIQAPFKCDLCYHGFIQEQTYEAHRLDKHDVSAGSFECLVCRFRFRSGRLLALHAKLHRKTYRCKTCNFSTTALHHARGHKKWHEGVTYKCKHCDEVSTKLTSHLSHVRIKHRSEFVCDVCGYSFVSELGLKQHRSRKHRQETATTTATTWFCGGCQSGFQSKAALRRHCLTSSLHSPPASPLAGCRHCGELFAGKMELKKHSRQHASPRKTTTNAQGYPIQCDQCGIAIECRRSHWRHYQRHHKHLKYPLARNHYVCEICGKGYQSRTVLSYHQRRHSGEKSEKGEKGEKSEKSEKGEKGKGEKGEGQFPCEERLCGKAFFTRHSLRQHSLTHISTDDTQAVP